MRWVLRSGAGGIDGHLSGSRVEWRRSGGLLLLGLGLLRWDTVRLGSLARTDGVGADAGAGWLGVGGPREGNGWNGDSRVGRRGLCFLGGTGSTPNLFRLAPGPAGPPLAGSLARGAGGPRAEWEEEEEGELEEVEELELEELDADEVLGVLGGGPRDADVAAGAGGGPGRLARTGVGGPRAAQSEDEREAELEELEELEEEPALGVVAEVVMQKSLSSADSASAAAAPSASPATSAAATSGSIP